MGIKIPLTGLLAVAWLGEAASLSTWVAVICSGLAVSLFGMGGQEPAQGGHGYRPAVAVVFVLLSSLAYAVSDLIAKRALDGVDPVSLVLWSNVGWAPLSAAMLMHPRYRKYRIKPLDGAVLFLRGGLVLGAVLGLYVAFRMAGGVILPNVVYGTRGFFALAAGYVLNRAGHVPMERQSQLTYAFRAIGAALLFTAVLVAVLT
jgi:hypothetical protein